MKKKLLLTLSIIFIFAVNLGAVELNLDKKAPVVTDVYDADYIFFGEKIDFQGEAKDLYLFGKNIDFSGKSKMALFSVAENITMTGLLENGVKAIGQIIKVEGNVKGTSFLAGEELMIDMESQIDGDIFSASKLLTIKGQINGNLRAGAAEISIQNEIHGDVNVYAGELTIPENGKIFGNLTYHSDKEITEEEASRVTGEVKFEIEEGDFWNDNFSESDLCFPIWLSILLKLSFIIFGLSP